VTNQQQGKGLAGAVLCDKAEPKPLPFVWAVCACWLVVTAPARNQERRRREGRVGRDHRLDEKKTAWVDCSPSGSPPGVRLLQGGASAGRVIEAGA
jgi:hypothetical protein